MFKFENIKSLFHSFYVHLDIFKISLNQIWLFMFKGLHWHDGIPDKYTIWCRFRPLIFMQNFRSFGHIVFPE
jgi:hypothetical protein